MKTSEVWGDEMDWEKQCHDLQLRIDELEEENRKLRLQLGLPTIDVVAESALPYIEPPAPCHSFSACFLPNR